MGQKNISKTRGETMTPKIIKSKALKMALQELKKEKRLHASGWNRKDAILTQPTCLEEFMKPQQIIPKKKKLKEHSSIIIEEKCVKCKRKIPFNEPKHNIRVNGKSSAYCQACANKILHSKEDADEA